MKYLLLFASAAFLTLVATPTVRRFALLLGATEQPESRKIHSKRIIARLGGIAICFSFYATLVIASFLEPASYLRALPFLKGIFPAGILILLLGVYDDLRGANAPLKFMVQLAAAGIVLHAGIQIELVTNPFASGASVSPGVWGVPLTILWIVFITNAVNLIDGLDGLAAGVSSIVAVTVFAIAAYQQNAAVMLLSATLAGSAAGFLRYNFNPAKIFMGDSGSLFLGFVLACLSIEGAHKSATAVTILVALLALGLPVGDALLAIVRRSLRRRNIFQADKEHIHHHLIKRGFKHKHAVLFLYGVSAACGVLAFSFVLLKDAFVGVMLIISAPAVYLLFRSFGRWLRLREGPQSPGARPFGPRTADRDLSVIIVNYNSGPLLCEALESVLTSSGKMSLEVIVVDNKSRDRSIAEARERFGGRVRFMENERNCGFARGCNIGMAQARGEFLVLLNPDTRVEPEALEKMLSCMRRMPDAGIVGSKLLNADGSLQLSCRSFPTVMTGLYNRYSLLTRFLPESKHARQYLLSDTAHDHTREVDWMSGACLMIRRAMLQDIGLLDESFFMYCEDIDICYRAQAKGWKVVYFPEAVVRHHIACGRDRASVSLIVWHHRSMYRFFKKHYLKGRVLPEIAAAIGMTLSSVLMMGYKKIMRYR